MTARPTARPGAALAERAKLLGPAGVEPSVDLNDLAEVIRLAFPGATPTNTAPTNATVLDEGLSA